LGGGAGTPDREWRPQGEAETAIAAATPATRLKVCRELPKAAPPRTKKWPAATSNVWIFWQAIVSR